jgi:hypothetical protein
MYIKRPYTAENERKTLLSENQITSWFGLKHDGLFRSSHPTLLFFRVLRFGILGDISIIVGTKYPVPLCHRIASLPISYCPSFPFRYSIPLLPLLSRHFLHRFLLFFWFSALSFPCLLTEVRCITHGEF